MRKIPAVSLSLIHIYPERAVQLYRRAAQQDYAPAMCNLAVCYLNGIGVERDEAKAVKRCV